MALPALAVDNTADGEAAPDIAHHQKLLAWIKSKNIAEEFKDDHTLLSKIGERVMDEYQIDETSRGEWKTKTEQAMDLAMQVAKEKQFPWPKAANVIFPLMTNASIQFAARAYPAIVQNKEVVKGVVVGDDDGIPTIDPHTHQPVTDPQTQQPVW